MQTVGGIIGRTSTSAPEAALRNLPVRQIAGGRSYLEGRHVFSFLQFARFPKFSPVLNGLLPDGHELLRNGGESCCAPESRKDSPEQQEARRYKEDRLESLLSTSPTSMQVSTTPLSCLSSLLLPHYLPEAPSPSPSRSASTSLSCTRAGWVYALAMVKWQCQICVSRYIFISSTTYL